MREFDAQICHLASLHFAVFLEFCLYLFIVRRKRRQNNSWRNEVSTRSHEWKIVRISCILRNVDVMPLGRVGAASETLQNGVDSNAAFHLMAASVKPNASHDVKNRFATKEGTYTLMNLSEYCRPNRLPYTVQHPFPVRISFVTLKEKDCSSDRIAFNVGKELYVYVYKGVKKAADLNKPLDKRGYKGTFPTCHDFNLPTRSVEFLELIIGFSAGQIQLIDPIGHELNKLYNEERQVDKTSVKCIKWIPGSENLFLAAYDSGNMYVYNKENPASPDTPTFSLLKKGPGFQVFGNKTKTLGNPVCKWTIGKGSINEFAFSPDCKHVAVVSQDGYLRIFDFDGQSLNGIMRSYFGGLLCVCWSPDGKYIVTGGEDDLITVFSFYENRVIARGVGHQSWVGMVRFDPYLTSVSGGGTLDDSDDEVPEQDIRTSTYSERHSTVDMDRPNASYRFGSVGQDTMLLLWDLTEEVLKPIKPRARSLRTQSAHTGNNVPNGPSKEVNHIRNYITTHNLSSSVEQLLDLDDKSFGSVICPVFDDVPQLEPLVAKKISMERLCGLEFREDCLIVACQEGYISTWARPGKATSPGTVV